MSHIKASKMNSTIGLNPYFNPTKSLIHAIQQSSWKEKERTRSLILEQY